jgi:putative ABC transport system permease protein
MLIALRDLQHRRRRFAISILAVGVVFGIALLLSGLSAAFGNEARRVVHGFEADAWVIEAGSPGPFSTAGLQPAANADLIAAVDGVEAVAPVLATGGTIREQSTNVLGVDFAFGFGPDLADGDLPSAPFEVVADSALGLDTDDRFDLAGQTWTVVGVTEGQRFYAGVPVVFAPYADVRDTLLEGLPAASSFVVRGTPTGPMPDGLRVVDDAFAVASLVRPVESAIDTIDAVRVLLWIVAAGIIGSIVYLSVLERLRDIAVLKAIGSSTASILGGLFVQAAVVALAATLLAYVVAVALGPRFPMVVELPASGMLLAPVVALVIAGVASLVGIRRAMSVDPALAFGA